MVDKEMTMSKFIEVVGSIFFFTALFGSAWFALVVIGG